MSTAKLGSASSHSTIVHSDSPLATPKHHPRQAVWSDSGEAILPSITKVVNVASVTHRSPFRYPGGKTWLVPAVRQWLASLAAPPSELIEPFAGGGIVGLTVAFDGLAPRVTLVELDVDVASVWKVMLNGQATWLADQIATFDIERENVLRLLQSHPSSLRERAFLTLLKNRVNRGGILAHGAGISKFGENGNGVASRWYPNTLRERILGIHAMRDHLQFIEGDGICVISANASRPDVAFFIDPPYTAAGKRAGLRLYRHASLDHEALFRAAESIRGPLLMTYDDCPEVEEMAHRHGFQTARIPMKNTHHAVMNELLIGRDLSWADERRLRL